MCPVGISGDYWMQNEDNERNLLGGLVKITLQKKPVSGLTWCLAYMMTPHILGFFCSLHSVQEY
jgi:hypothetical protein